VAALLTPFTAGRDEGLDLGALREHVRLLVDEGMDGFLLCGTTGEGPLLDDDEVAQATRAAAEACRGRARVMTQVGRPSTAGTLRLLSRAKDAGADGLVVVAPYYYQLDDAQVEAHFAAALALAGDRPLFAYNIPRRTGNDLGPPLVRRLAERGLAGLKDSTRSLERHREYLRIAREPGLGGFGVFMGSDVHALSGLMGGSAGLVSAAANARPELLVALRAAVEEGRPADAVRLQSEIDAVRESVGAAGTIPGLKSAVASCLAARGVSYPTAVRAPLGPALPRP
jgi:dihydrodipicolinate synthase/N-acetylneuraminate lyase